MKKLYFNLKKKWYDRIKSGEPEPETGSPKLIEYRSVTHYWEKRLGLDKQTEIIWFDDNVVVGVFRLGYKRGTDIYRKIVKIDRGKCPYEGWDGEYFRIHFSKEDFVFDNEGIIQ